MARVRPLHGWLHAVAPPRLGPTRRSLWAAQPELFPFKILDSMIFADVQGVVRRYKGKGRGERQISRGARVKCDEIGGGAELEPVLRAVYSSEGHVADVGRKWPGMVAAKARISTEGFLRFENVQKSYDGETLVVDNLNLEIERGEFLTLLGP